MEGNKRRHLVVSLFVGVLLSMQMGCGLVYNSRRDDLLATAKESDYGPPPPESHQQAERDLIIASLKDPDSAKIEFGAVARDAIQDGPLSPTPMLVWTSAVRVNAKNSYGGYTGYQPYHFAWKDEHVVAIAYPSVSVHGTHDGYWQYLK